MATPHRTQALTFGPAGHRLYGVLHAPKPEAPLRKAGWLFCAAYGEERDTAGRIVHEFAEALAARGYWCLRYDPAGNGNSEGHFSDFTVEDHLADVPLAVAELERRSDQPCGGLFGLRCGASLAVRARAANDWDLPLLLWEPIPNGKRYADELLRSVMTTRMAARGAPSTREELRTELAAGAELAVRGHVLTGRAVAALDAVDLLSESLGGRGPALVIQIDRKEGRKPRPALAKLVRALEAAGRVSFEQAHGCIPWVLTNTDYDVRPAGLLEPTLRWLDEIADERAARPLTTRKPVATTSGEERWPEQPVAISVEGDTIRGLLHEPASPQPGRPILLMPVMSALFQVKLARALGAQGWASLRFDPRGKGDSDGHLDYPTVSRLHFAVQSGLLVPDLAAVIRYATGELGYPSAIPVGICGDAITAVFEAPADPRVVGLAPLELPLLTTLQRGQEGAAGQARHVLAEKIFARGTRRGEQVRRLLYRARWGYRQVHAAGRRLLSPVRNRGLVSELAGRLGERANEPLLAGLVGCLERELPMLLLYGSQRMDGPSGFDRIVPLLEERLPAGARSLQHRLIDGADHHFSTPEHSAEARADLLAWLEARERPWNPAGGRP